MYTYKDIYLKWPYGTIQLQDIRLEHEIGEHAKLQVTGILDPQHEHEIITRAGSDDQIELGIRDEEGSKPLFMGQLSHIELQNVQHNLQVKIEVTSQSYKLDTRFKERSFQQVNRTYIDIVHSVIADYAKSDVLDEAFGERKTGQFIMQYQETDWAFLKRIASHAGAVLVPYVLSHGINFWIGLPESRRQIDLHEVHFRHRKVVDPYLRDTAQGKDSSIENYNRYSFEWDDILDIGDTVVRSKQNYRIIKRSAAMDKGLLKWEYECMPAQGVTVPKQWNRMITGAAIEGKVLEVRKNQVRLHLDIDEYQSPKDAQWFPYSAEGNQVWYLMPEQGAQLKLYFPSMNEDDAVAIQSVRTEALTPEAPAPAAMAAASSAQTSSGSKPESVTARKERKMSDPGTKSFANPQGKEVSLSGSDLSLIGQEGAMYMSLSGSGVGLHSPLRIQVTAGGTLNLNASEMTIQGDEGLQLSTPQHTIELNKFASTLSPKIKLQASTRRAHPKIIPPGSSEAVFLQYGAEEMKFQVTKKHMDARNEQFNQVFKDTWSGILQLSEDVGDLAVTGKNVAFGDATWEGSKQGLMERNSLANSISYNTKNNIDYFDSAIHGEKSPGTLLSDAWHSAIDPVVETAKPFAEVAHYVDPTKSTLAENMEYGRSNGEALQTMMIFGATRGAGSGLKYMGKKTGITGKAGKKEAGGAVGASSLFGRHGKDIPGIGQGGVKTGATALLLMARSAFSRTGGKGSSMLAGLMSRQLVDKQPFQTKVKKIQQQIRDASRASREYLSKKNVDWNPSNYRPVRVKRGLVGFGTQVVYGLERREDGNRPLFHLGGDGKNEQSGHQGKDRGPNPKHTNDFIKKIPPDTLKQIECFRDPKEMLPYIKPPAKGPEGGIDAWMERDYIKIRKSGLDDIEIVAKNTGLSPDEVAKIKIHMFYTVHDISNNGKPFIKQFFQADQDVAYSWLKAQHQELSPVEKDWFKQLANHEITESIIMKNGVTFKKKTTGEVVTIPGPMPLRDPKVWNPDKKQYDWKGREYNPKSGKDELSAESYDMMVSHNAHDAANVTDINPPEYPYPANYDLNDIMMKYYGRDTNLLKE